MAFKETVGKLEDIVKKTWKNNIVKYFTCYSVGSISSYIVSGATLATMYSCGASPTTQIIGAALSKMITFNIVNIGMYYRVHRNEYQTKKEAWVDVGKHISTGAPTGTMNYAAKIFLHAYLLEKGWDDRWAYGVGYVGPGFLSAALKFGGDYFTRLIDRRPKGTPS